MNAGDRFEVVMDYRGGGLLGRRGRIVELIGSCALTRNRSLVRAWLDDDRDVTVFYIEEIRVLDDPVTLIAELAP